MSTRSAAPAFAGAVAALLTSPVSAQALGIHVVHSPAAMRVIVTPGDPIVEGAGHAKARHEPAHTGWHSAADPVGRPNPVPPMQGPNAGREALHYALLTVLSGGLLGLVPAQLPLVGAAVARVEERERAGTAHATRPARRKS